MELIIFLGGLVLAIMWIVFPFIVCSRLADIRQEIKNTNAELHEINKTLDATLLESHRTQSNTGELAGFFRDRNIEVGK